MSWIRGQQDASYIYINMLRVSSDVSIQERHWQPLSVHLWAYCNPPIAHDMGSWWCVKGRSHHRGDFPYSFRTVVWVLYVPFDFTNERRMKETRPTVYMLRHPQWRDHRNWDKLSNYSQDDLNSFLKTLLVGPVRAWTWRPPAQQTDRCSPNWANRAAGVA